MNKNKNKHLTLDERYVIEHSLNDRYSFKQIDLKLGKDCTTIGMKKFFTTTVHESARGYDRIMFSAGKIGYQVKVAPADLEKMIVLTYKDLIVV